MYNIIYYSIHDKTYPSISSRFSSRNKSSILSSSFLKDELGICKDRAADISFVPAFPRNHQGFH